MKGNRVRRGLRAPFVRTEATHQQTRGSNSPIRHRVGDCSIGPHRAQFATVRRLIPWLLLSLLLLGAAAGTALGTAQKSTSATPSQWVADVLAATEKAGRAHFSYTHVTSSPDPELRGTLSGYGVVDFTTGDVRVTEIDRDITFTSTGKQPLHPVHSTTTEDAIVIGGTVYQANPIPGVAFAEKYRVLAFPALLPSQRGLSLALNAAVALDALHETYAVASLTDLGPAEVDGVATTQYEVGYAPLHVCAPHQAPQTLTQHPSSVWIDSAGRLVQVRSTLYFNGRLPDRGKLPAALAGFPQGPTTTIATLTFSEFGEPVHVAAPPASAILPDDDTSTGFAVARIDTCPSSREPNSWRRTNRGPRISPDQWASNRRPGARIAAADADRPMPRAGAL